MPWFTRLLALFLPVLLPIAQAVDGFSWEKLFGATGLSAWAVMAGLFISDKIRTTTGAQREIDGWKEVARLHAERADKWEEKAQQATDIAAKAVSMLEQANAAAKKGA